MSIFYTETERRGDNLMDARGREMKQSNGRNVINTIHKWTAWVKGAGCGN